MLHKQHFRLINGFVHHIKNTLFCSCFFYLGRLILPIISYLSRGAYFLHLSSFPCFTARLPFSQNALGGLCCRWLSLLPLRCCQGMQTQPAQNPGRSHSQVKALCSRVKQHTLNSRKLTGLLNCTLTRGRAEEVAWTLQQRLLEQTEMHKNPQGTARAGPATAQPKEATDCSYGT